MGPSLAASQPATFQTQRKDLNERSAIHKELIQIITSLPGDEETLQSNINHQGVKWIYKTAVRKIEKG